MVSVKQGGIRFHFFSLWYDSTWDWTSVTRTIGGHNALGYSDGDIIIIVVIIGFLV